MEPFTLGHRRALDGLRGLAIILVLLSHIPKLPFQGGFVGVDLFFVLSGFLITSLLLEEWRSSGDLSLKAFYARRALRLLPALLLMLAFVVVAGAILEPPKEFAAMKKAALMTLFYSANWFLAYGAYPRPDLSPTWSLSMEEQFYLLWPLVLLLMLRAGLSRRATALVVTAALLASAGARAWLAGSGHAARAYFGADTHADGLLAGALVSMLAYWGLLPTPTSRTGVLNGAAVLMVALIAFLSVRGWAFDPFFLQVGYLGLNLGVAVLTACLVSAPWAPLRAAFEFAPLVWIGRVSYGLYLWHLGAPYVLRLTRLEFGNWYWAAWTATTFGCAALSFYVLERPILRFKKRYERVASATPISP